MFERYTEAARRLIFHARQEAVESGSPCIEAEHFALALLQEEESLTRRLLPPDSIESIDGDIRATIARCKASDPKTDTPLSNSMKRVLANGADAAEALSDPHIGTEHLLLGLLIEKDYPVVRILEKFGIIRDRH